MRTAGAAPSAVPDGILEDLRTRIRATHRIALPGGEDWSLGVDLEYLQGLLRTWADEYDWRDVEARVAALPWALTERQEVPIRAVHQRAAAGDEPVVVLLHGWPDSVLRFSKVLPLLTDVHVVVPALPGYPFAAPAPRMSAAAMGSAVAAAMVELGYERYIVSAGDVGTDVAEALASQHPDRVVGLHLTDLSHHHALVDPPENLTEPELAYLDLVHRWHAADGAYNHLQSTRPDTIAVALGDSPAGLAAWILDKLVHWSDSGGDVEAVFTRTDILDWITAYWVTGAIGTSFAPYVRRERPAGPITAPAVFTMFPGDLVNAPREFAARFFDVRSWTTAPAGGHFDAWERPQDYVAGVRAALRNRRR